MFRSCPGHWRSHERGDLWVTEIEDLRFSYYLGLKIDHRAETVRHASMYVGCGDSPRNTMVVNATEAQIEDLWSINWTMSITPKEIDNAHGRFTRAFTEMWDTLLWKLI